MPKTLTFASAVCALALALASQARAHAHLTATAPAADATVAAPHQLMLHFSEKMIPKFSGLDLAKTGGAKVTVESSVGKDGLTLIATPAQPLSPGAYTVNWHVVTADTHRMEGSYSFTVR
jgi:methionine-rich copper-binding protein CopC